MFIQISAVPPSHRFLDHDDRVGSDVTLKIIGFRRARV